MRRLAIVVPMCLALGHAAAASDVPVPRDRYHELVAKAERG